MTRLARRIPIAVLLVMAVGVAPAPAVGVEELVSALLRDTPLVRDLQLLTDEVGGRPTGSAANRRAVERGVARFRRAGLAATRESFAMPALWLDHARSNTFDRVDLQPQMIPFGVYDAWLAGTRGRKP